jgi:RNA polymerase sigma-70 factor (ECF subfamily)
MTRLAPGRILFEGRSGRLGHGRDPGEHDVGREPDALVAAARLGDQAAWRDLYVLHAGRLVTWLRWLPRADAASSAEDVAAQAWLTAASKIHGFEGSDEEFAGWLFAIARKHAANDHRRGVRRQTRPGAAETGGTVLFSGDGDEIGRVVEQDSIRRLLAELSPREAEVIACVDVVGLDVRSAAAALGMKPTAVRVARHRALNRLRKLLSEPEGGPVPGPELGDAPG